MIMGFRKWLAGKLYKPTEERPPETPPRERQKVKGYELYGKAPGEKWMKLQDLSQPMDFEDIEDAEPGVAYRLQERYESGQVRQLWYRYVEGPKEARIVSPVDAMKELLAPFEAFGKSIGELQEQIRGAFGWAFPQSQGVSTTTGIQYKGEVPIMLHPAVAEGFKSWMPVFKDGAREIGSGLREGFFGEGGKEKAAEEKGVKFSRPPPRPEDFAEKAPPAKEAS